MRRRLLGGAIGPVDASVSAENGDSSEETLANRGVSIGYARTRIGREEIAPR